jgi:hypothetical protein
LCWSSCGYTTSNSHADGPDYDGGANRHERANSDSGAYCHERADFDGGVYCQQYRASSKHHK